MESVLTCSQAIKSICNYCCCVDPICNAFCRVDFILTKYIRSIHGVNRGSVRYKRYIVRQQRRRLLIYDIHSM